MSAPNSELVQVLETAPKLPEVTLEFLVERDIPAIASHIAQDLALRNGRLYRKQVMTIAGLLAYSNEFRMFAARACNFDYYTFDSKLNQLRDAYKAHLSAPAPAQAIAKVLSSMQEPPF